MDGETNHPQFSWSMIRLQGVQGSSEKNETEEGEQKTADRVQTTFLL